ncbi:MAG: FtsX-like permease family protein [Lachnospiraceae bacterium]|nr:FtsX-like permease family protein [Lachnospiraceae bacterium]
MYLRILKKDLKRKRTMNSILLIFVILGVMFTASSVNNMVTVAMALDRYFEIANVPDYWYATSYEEEAGRVEEFARDNGYELCVSEMVQVDPRSINVQGERFEYSSSVVLAQIGDTKVFDGNGQEITRVNDGEIYISAEIFHSVQNDFHIGGKIEITSEGKTKEFTLKGFTKDALFGSSMMGMTRFLVSDNDRHFFESETCTKFYSLLVYTSDDAFTEKFEALNVKTMMSVDRAGMKMMYIMDMLIAAIVLIVSICLILISMVILQFTISFTVSEEFREIGVMKAIGISNRKIRGLYILKYFAISVVGAILGLTLSFPFGNLLIQSVSNNIIISGQNKTFLNVICAVGTAAVVAWFCYLCTHKIKKFSPIAAIRNGEMGERYQRKGLLRLGKSHLTPAAFLAVNDVLSSVRRYLSMILIFTLGLLLVIIPVNSINTLQSDKLLPLFNMADCDLVISQELLFSANGTNEEMIDKKQEEVKETLLSHGIRADVFQEIMFRFYILHGDKKMSSLAFKGKGEVRADEYTYLEGTPPENDGEVAITYLVADKIGAQIGDKVKIDMGGEVREYRVTAINQSMNNFGEGIRFYEGDDVDYNYAAGSFGIQIRYRDNPDGETLRERKKLLKRVFDETDVYEAGEYISYMIGDVAGQLEGVKSLILGIILCINILVAVLMVKSFITKEKGEIAMLKALGFGNACLVAWQSMRIGMVLLISIVIGTLISTPLSKLTIEPIFHMMGAYSIEFDVVPLEVYVVYPLAVLAATVLAAVTGAALPLRKISAAETSNIE